MKRSFFILSMLFCMVCQIQAGLSRGIELSMRTVSSSQYNDDEEPEEGVWGERVPTRPIYCHINEEDGIIFYTNLSPDIITYEIYDVEEICIAVFSDETDFIEFLFTLSGDFQLVFTTTHFNLVGWVSI